MSGSLSLEALFALVIAFFGTRWLTPLNIRLAGRYNLLAQPNDRSIHTYPTPTAGGITFGILGIILQLGIGLMNYRQSYGIYLIRLGLISIPLLLFGILDDRYQSRARYKLLWQVITALLMFWAGYRVTYLTNPVGDNFPLGWMSLPMTIFWFVLMMNAINLIDGLDGLASGITCIVSVVLATIALREGNVLAVILAGILFGSNLAFLKYNFSPATIFMGDTGSLIIGLNLAAISTAGNASYKGLTAMTLMVPFIALAIPLLDTALAFFRRIGTGSIFRADKAHIHHYLLALGLSQKTIALITYFVTSLFGLAALGFSFSPHKVVFSTLVVLMAVLIILAYFIMHKGRKS